MTARRMMSAPGRAWRALDRDTRGGAAILAVPTTALAVIVARHGGPLPVLPVPQTLGTLAVAGLVASVTRRVRARRHRNGGRA